MNGRYEIGDTVVYESTSGRVRECIVESKDPNIKHGYSGFTGTTTDGEQVWGYDDDIIRVIRKDGAR